MHRLLLLLIALFSFSSAEENQRGKGCLGSTAASVAVFGKDGSAGSATIGYSYLVKTTYTDEHSCVYILPPHGQKDNEGRYPYYMGYKDEGNQWKKINGTITIQGSNISDNDPDYGQTVTTVLYTHLDGGCDVTTFQGATGNNNVGGPYLELWYHSGASQFALECCKGEFEKQLKNFKSTDVREINQGCNYADVIEQKS
uniref:Salivary lipocalin n=1 Tax=Ornithodoros moubata TaxID=6938 RepID=F6K8G8_ORNMO|nr:salivary lipocalin [Ornithodoros moubata]